MKTLTSTIKFQDSLGNAVAGGYIILTLSQETIITSGGGQVAPRSVKITLDTGGLVTAAQTIWANDELTPAGTVYIVNVFDSSNNLIYGPQNWALTGSSPIDLSAITPTTTNTLVYNSAPGGSSGQVEFNNAGVFGGVSGSSVDNSAGLITLGSGVKFSGATSGSETIGVAAVAGTPNKINLPVATGTANQFLKTDGANPQQTSWATVPALNTAETWTALQTFAGISLSVVSKNTNYTATTADCVILVDASGGAKTITLPVSGNQAFRVKKTDSSGNAVTIAGASGNVDGAANTTLTTQYASKDFHSDGTNFWIF